uniref:Uncharacterized protein n=1 Tax=Arundo donax TaxID=35708 RepID=A0A0A9H975_ARUDO
MACIQTLALKMRRKSQVVSEALNLRSCYIALRLIHCVR